MSDPLLKPKSAYESAFANREAIAERKSQRLFDELSAQKEVLSDHGYSLDREGAMVVVRKGNLDIARVIFNSGDTGRHKVVNGVAEALGRGLPVDFDDPEVAIYEFKVQLRAATDMFYANRDRFRILRLG